MYSWWVCGGRLGKQTRKKKLMKNVMMMREGEFNTWLVVISVFVKVNKPGKQEK